MIALSVFIVLDANGFVCVCHCSVESKDSKSVPGVWIKSVWGTRQEVDDLDLAIQQALELEHIDCSKYFTRYT